MKKESCLDVQIWTIDLDISNDQRRSFESILSRDELDRSRRFATEKLRSRWVCAHASLRLIVAKLIGCDPADLRFRQGPQGKPEVEHPHCSLRFNLSRSCALALVGISCQFPLGIDVEHVRHIPEMDDIADAQFSSAERAALRRLQATEQLQAFFNCWTRKEAYIKALGVGLSARLADFDVTLAPNQAARLISINGRSEAARTWSLIHLEPKPSYVGALALEHSGPLKVVWKRLPIR